MIDPQTRHEILAIIREEFPKLHKLHNQDNPEFVRAEIERAFPLFAEHIRRGIRPPKLKMVGEDGPELVQPVGATYSPDSTTVVANSPLTNMSANEDIRAIREAVEGIHDTLKSVFGRRPRTGEMEGKATDNTRCAVIHEEDCNE